MDHAKEAKNILYALFYIKRAIEHLSGYLSFIYCSFELGIFDIKNHRLVNSDPDPGFIALVSGRMIVGLIVYAIAIATSYLNAKVTHTICSDCYLLSRSAAIFLVLTYQK
jgi:hypothetical protein